LPPFLRGGSVEIVPQAGGGDPHHAEERRQRHLLAPGQAPALAGAVEHDVDVAALGEIVGQGAGERAHGIVAPVVEHVDRLDVDLQNLPGFRAPDRDRTGADVARHHLARDLLVNGRERLRDDERRRRHQFGAARHRRDGHALAAVDGQPRLEAGVEIAPVHGVRAGFEVRDGHGAWSAAGEAVTTACFRGRSNG